MTRTSLPLRLSLHSESWPALQPIRIAGHTWESFDMILVDVTDGEHVGRGEGLGVYYLGETTETMTRQIESVAGAIERGIDNEGLQRLLPPGGARNAVDCALWDLRTKRSGTTVWELTGITPRPVTTVYTLGIAASLETMATAAHGAPCRFLKIKLDGEQPVERMTAIRRARPDASLIVDANQSWTFEQLKEVAPALAELGVEMIEQPLPRGGDGELEGYACPVPLGADESCQHRGDLEAVADRYRAVNIKLDKTGGLTEALLLAGEARARGLDLMIGNMSGTSLSMAPGFVIAQLCRFVDLDGPLLMKYDRLPAVQYLNGEMTLPERNLWG